MTSREHIARNIIEKHGKVGLFYLLKSLQEMKPYRAIGKTFKVSPQRVNQWAEALGSRWTRYVVHADVRKIADETTGEAGGV